MARIFITGSADGLGQMTADLLVKQGHQVALHARNAERGRDALHKVPGAEKVLIADLSRIEETRQLAAEVNAMGSFDAVIHNAGVYNVSNRALSKDGLPLIFAVNSLAPYILTCLIQKPGRLIYLSSGMHMQGNPKLSDLNTETLHARNSVTYSDSKLHDVILSMAVARKWPEVFSNALDPGWVPTKMGGAGAPDNLEEGFLTQAWLAVSNDREAKVTGQYFYHKKAKRYLPVAADPTIQDKFLSLCEKISGVVFPA